MGCEDIHKEGEQKCKGLKPHTVSNRNGDIMLCDDCNERRFGKPKNTATTVTAENPPQAAKAKTTQAVKAKTTQAVSNVKQPTNVITIEDAATVIKITHQKSLDSLSLDQLKTFDTENTRSSIQGTLASLLPMGQDPATIANVSVEIANDLRNYAKSRETLLLQDNEVSFTDRILAAAASPIKRIEKTNTAESSVTCLDSCHHPQAKGKPITCSLCQAEFHPQCVGVSTNGRRAVWFCYSCRNIPRTLKNLEQRYTLQSGECATLRESNERLKATLEEQSTVIANLQDQLNAASKPTAEPTPKVSTLIIGDSMIKDINPKGLESTEVQCMPGAKTTDIKDHLAAQESLPYDTIIVHVGTNDEDVDTAREALESTMDDITNKAPNATKILSTACPRPDGDMDRINNINEMIKETAANTSNCMLVDNDDAFLDDGHIDNSAYKYRSIHLSKTGTRTLLRNLNSCHKIIKGSTKANTSNAKRRPARQNPTRPRDVRQNAHHGHNAGHRNATRSRDIRSQQSAFHGHYGATQSRRRGCYHCGEQNHQKRNCRFTRPVQCYDCGDFGHKRGMNMCNNF